MRSPARWATGLVVVAGLIALGVWHVEASAQQVLTQVYTQPPQPLAIAPSPQMAAEGQRLIRVNGCAGCHGAHDTGRVTLRGWFGTRLVAPNLSVLAHKLSVQQLAAAIRYGVKPDGTSVLAMPVHRFLRESDGDIAAIIAYLKTRAPQSGAAGSTHWDFGGKVMLAMGIIPAAAAGLNRADRGPLHTPTAPMALGRYLTHTQCAACHGADLSGEAEEHSPDLRFAIQHYSLAAFETFFRTGTGRLGHGTQTMTPLIKARLQYLTTDEVRAIYVYLNHSKARG